MRLRSTEYTHNPRILATIERMVAINSAVEVDLTGQVNAEVAKGSYLGAVGGALDFIRAANQSAGGVSLMLLPGRAHRGKALGPGGHAAQRSRRHRHRARRRRPARLQPARARGAHARYCCGGMTRLGSFSVRSKMPSISSVTARGPSGTMRGSRMSPLTPTGTLVSAPPTT